MRLFLKLICFYAMFTVVSCSGPADKPDDQNPGDTTKKASIPNNFNMDSAYQYVQNQVDFGPRVPNSDAHEKCAQWLKTQLQKWTDTVYVQNFVSKNYKGEDWRGTNLVGAIILKTPIDCCFAHIGIHALGPIKIRLIQPPLPTVLLMEQAVWAFC